MCENAQFGRSSLSSVPSAAQGRPRPLEKRTLVFANSTDAAEAVSKLLTSQGLSPLKYHSGQTATDKAAAIRRFSEQGGVLVCTDAAARGLDVPDVGHVIQVRRWGKVKAAVAGLRKAVGSVCEMNWLLRFGRAEDASLCGSWGATRLASRLVKSKTERIYNVHDPMELDCFPAFLQAFSLNILALSKWFAAVLSSSFWTSCHPLCYIHTPFSALVCAGGVCDERHRLPAPDWSQRAGGPRGAGDELLHGGPPGPGGGRQGSSRGTGASGEPPRVSSGLCNTSLEESYITSMIRELCSDWFHTFRGPDSTGPSTKATYQRLVCRYPRNDVARHLPNAGSLFWYSCNKGRGRELLVG